MTPTRLSIAHLGNTQQQLLQELEAEFGCWIVAYQQEAALAQLTPEGHVKLRQLENELGVALVACEPTVRFSLAQPSEEQLERLRAAERELEPYPGGIFSRARRAHASSDAGARRHRAARDYLGRGA